MIRWLGAWTLLLIGCEGGGAPTLVGPCAPCERTAECATPLRCVDFVCLDDATSCAAGQEGEGEGEGTEPRGGCAGMCEAAGRPPCEGLGLGRELGVDEAACAQACAAGSPGVDSAVLDCLRRRVDQGDCASAAIRECLPPWAPTLRPGVCEDVDCECGLFCADAMDCGMFEGSAIDINEAGCVGLCVAGERESPGSLGCVVSALEAGRCESAAMLECFGLDDGGRPPGDG